MPVTHPESMHIQSQIGSEEQEDGSKKFFLYSRCMPNGKTIKVRELTPDMIDNHDYGLTDEECACVEAAGDPT